MGKELKKSASSIIMPLLELGKKTHEPFTGFA
jgi:hypothetical protein